MTPDEEYDKRCELADQIRDLPIFEDVDFDALGDVLKGYHDCLDVGSLENLLKALTK